MALLLNKPMFEKNLNQLFADSLAFYIGFNLFSSKASKEATPVPVDDFISVFEEISGISGGLTPAVKNKIKTALEERGIGITDAGIEKAYKHYYDCMIG